MAKMYPNFVKKVVISSSGVGFMSISLDELLARNNLSSMSKVMLPSSVKGMKVFLANVTYKAIDSYLPIKRNLFLESCANMAMSHN